MLYNPPTGAATVNDAYVGKNVAAGIQGSKVPPKGVETPQREIVNAEMAAGLSPSNGDMTQLAQAMSIGLWLGTMGGTANAITDALPTLALQADGVTPYAIPALVAGMTFHGIIPATNTGPATLALSGFGTAPGPKPIVRKDNTPLQAGDLPANATVSWRFDGTSFRVVGMVQSDLLGLIQSVVGTKLTGNITVYVRPDGSDTANNGLADTAVGAFKTPQGAYNYLTRNYFFAGYSPTIQLSKTYSPGSVTTYPGLVATNVGVTGTVVLQGDAAAPQNYVLTPVALVDGTSACAASSIASLLVVGVTLDGSTLTSGSPARALVGGTLNRGNCILKMPSGSQPTVSAVQVDPQGITARTGPETVLGQGGSVLSYSNTLQGGADLGSTDGSVLTVSNLTVAAFYQVAGRASLPSGGFVASGVTGPRYRVLDVGVLVLGTVAEASIPGTTTGTMYGGGQVDGGVGYTWTLVSGLYAGNGTIAGSGTVYYRRIDKTIFWSVVASITSASSCTVALVTAPPFAPSIAGGGGGRETGSTGKAVGASIGVGDVRITLSMADVSALAAGYNLVASGFYAIAA